ncbi:MAG: IclR family transcriptional regulator C-terminal domain-containing protein [Rhizobiaceae bacterium]|nr:IclR family transcriptional regulator C-terminal domain-containing protein [Rhizobiaceae bacterium]
MAEISSTGDQMLVVLECVAGRGPLSATQVSELCGLNRTIVHRLLNTLIKSRYVHKLAQGYVLGSAAYDLSRSATNNLMYIAREAMEVLSCELDETIILHSISGSEAMAIDQVLSKNRLLMVRHTPGSRHALHRGASGWALLAFQTDKFIENYTKALCLQDAAAVSKRVNEIRKLGYARSSDELQLGVAGLFVPILNEHKSCDFSLGVLVPSSREHELDGMEQRLMDVSGQLTLKNTSG